MRGNYVHHNKGIGLWCDGNCTGVTFDGNTIEDNAWDGIQYEISYDGAITNNLIRRNGWSNPNAAEGAGIMVSNSGGLGLEVSGNTLVGNKNGIILLQADRGTGTAGPWVVRNVRVHDNTVTLSGNERTGAYRYSGDTGLWTVNNNHFEHNTYSLQGAAAAPFLWQGANRTDVEWRSYGNDETGVFNR